MLSYKHYHIVRGMLITFLSWPCLMVIFLTWVEFSSKRALITARTFLMWRLSMLSRSRGEFHKLNGGGGLDLIHYDIFVTNFGRKQAKGSEIATWGERQSLVCMPIEWYPKQSRIYLEVKDDKANECTDCILVDAVRKTCTFWVLQSYTWKASILLWSTYIAVIYTKKEMFMSMILDYQHNSRSFFPGVALAGFPKMCRSYYILCHSMFRDAFYFVLRSWEKHRDDPKWTIKDQLGDKIQ